MSISSEITRLTGLRNRLRAKIRSWSILFSQSADLEDCVDFLENAVTTKDAATYTPTTTDQTINPGTYVADTQTILGDANLIPANIVSGVSIFGVTGTASTGGSGLVYETGTYKPTANAARPTISFSKTYSVPPMLVMMVDATGTADTTTNAGMAFAYVDTYRLSSNGFPYSSSAWRYGFAAYAYRGTNTSQLSAGATMFSYNSDNAGSSTSSYARYYATTSEFIPYAGSTSRYWIANRTYKWIAIWAA